MLDILFVVPTDELKISSEVNGTMLLGTILLQNGFDVDILRFAQVGELDDYPRFIERIVQRILDISPKCVSFYTLWAHYHIMLRICKELKSRNPEIITVFGGPQASATAVDTMSNMPFVDYICSGEGEQTVVPFFDAVLNKDGNGLDRVPGLYYRLADGVHSNAGVASLCDLEKLPYWDDRLYLKNYDKVSQDSTGSDDYFLLDVGRGCPYSCTFCCTSNFWRRTYRLKSPERIIEDICYYQNKLGINSFAFTHDAFTTNMPLVSQVCDRIIEKGLDINWSCSARIDCITEELIQKMIKSGMSYISLGIESGSARMQKLINKNLNLKKVHEMIAYLAKQKIFVHLFYMYGFPEETEQDLNDTLDLLFDSLDCGVSRTSMSFCRFNPSTDITNRNFDQLTFNPEIKTLSHRIFGYREEIQMIKENKAIFPFFYNLDTPVRNSYQHLNALNHLYRQFPRSIKYVRKLYNGDNLKFYRDFCKHNSLDTVDTVQLADQMNADPLPIIYNTIQNLSTPNLPQAKALLKYDVDVQRISKSKTDIEFIETYDFNYYDYRLKLPIEQYTQGKTTLRMQKKNGVFDIKLLKISQ